MPFINSNDFNLDDIEELPPTPSRPEKRPRLDADETGLSTSAVNGNLLAFAKRFAVSKKLRPDQMTEVESFLNVSV